MKTLQEYISESYRGTINESFKCSLLQEISSGMKKYFKSLGDDYYAYRAMYNILPKIDISWDKITDDMIEWYDPKDPIGVRKVKNLQSEKSDKDGFAVMMDPENDSVPVLIMFKYGNMYCCKDASVSVFNYGHTKTSTKELFTANKFGFFDLDEHPEIKINPSDANSRLSRNTAKQGIVYNDAEFYEKVAESNIRRYKNIIAKNHIKDVNLEEFVETVRNVVDKALECVKKYASGEVDPDKWMQISRIMQMIYWQTTDKQVGILPLLNYCVQNIGVIQDAKVQSYVSTIEYLKNTKADIGALNGKIKQIEKEIEKI